MGNGMIAQTKTNCFWFHLGPTLLSGWVSHQTTAGAETVQMEGEKNDHFKTVCTCLNANVVWIIKCRNGSVWVCVSLLGKTSRLKVRSKATVLARGGGGGHYLWVADMREKWNPLSDPNDVFFWSEKSKHVHCSVMWPSVGVAVWSLQEKLVFQLERLLS